MKQNLVSYLPLRHRYENASHEAGIPLANIPAAMDHTTEVHHQSFERFIPDGKVDCMPNATRGPHKYGKKTQLAQILCSSSSDSPMPCNYSVFLDCVYRS